MKLRFFLISVLSLALVGCSSQRKTVGETPASLVYRQAVAALDKGHFTIELNQVFFPSDRTPINTLDSYITVRDGRGSIHYSPEIFSTPTAFGLKRKDIENGEARIILGKRKKNGDRHYTLNVEIDKIYERYKILIILYMDTNDCFVRFYGGVVEGLYLSARGKVYPEARQGLGTSRR